MGRIITPRGPDALSDTQDAQPNAGSSSRTIGIPAALLTSSTTPAGPVSTFRPATVSDWTSLFSFESTPAEAAQTTLLTEPTYATERRTNENGVTSLHMSRTLQEPWEILEVLESDEEGDVAPQPGPITTTARASMGEELDLPIHPEAIVDASRSARRRTQTQPQAHDSSRGDARPSAATAQRIIDRLSAARSSSQASSNTLPASTSNIQPTIQNSALLVSSPDRVMRYIFMIAHRGLGPMAPSLRTDNGSRRTPIALSVSDRNRSHQIVRDVQARYTGVEEEGWVIREVKRGLEEAGLGYLIRGREVAEAANENGGAAIGDREREQRGRHFSQEEGEGDMVDVPANGSVIIMDPAPPINPTLGPAISSSTTTAEPTSSTPAPVTTTATAPAAHRPQAPGSLADMGISSNPFSSGRQRIWIRPSPPSSTNTPTSTTVANNPTTLPPRSAIAPEMRQDYEALLVGNHEGFSGRYGTTAEVVRESIRLEANRAIREMVSGSGAVGVTNTSTSANASRSTNTVDRHRTESEQVIDQAIEEDRERRFERTRQALNESARRRAREALRRAMDGAGMMIGSGEEDARISEEMVSEFVRLEQHVLGVGREDRAGQSVSQVGDQEEEEVSTLWEEEWRNATAAGQAETEQGELSAITNAVRGFIVARAGGGAPARLMDMLERVTEAEEPDEDTWANPTLSRTRARPQSHEFDNESRRLRRRTERMLEAARLAEAEGERDRQDTAGLPNDAPSGLNIASSDSLRRIAGYPSLTASQDGEERDAPAVAGIGRTEPVPPTETRENRPPLAFGTTRRYFEEPETMVLDFPYIAPELLRSAVAAGGIAAPTTSSNVTTSPLSLARRAAVRRRRPLDPAAAPFIPWTNERTVERVTANANANAASRARSLQARRYLAERHSTDDRTRNRAMRSLADRQSTDKFLTRREWQNWVIARPMSTSSIIARDGAVLERGHRLELKYAEPIAAAPYVPFERRDPRSNAESGNRYAEFSALFGSRSRSPSPEPGLNSFGDAPDRGTLRYYPTRRSEIDPATGEPRYPPQIRNMFLSDSEDDDEDDHMDFGSLPEAMPERTTGYNGPAGMLRDFLGTGTGGGIGSNVDIDNVTATYPSISSPLRPRTRQTVASGSIGMTYEDIVDELRRAEGDEDMDGSDPMMII